MKITIFGTGTWGTALAQVLSDNNHEPLMYGIVDAQVNDINNNHRNTFFFGEEVKLSPTIKATTDFAEALAHSDIYLLAVPSVALRALAEQINANITKEVLLINTAKGFDPETNARLSTTLRKAFSPNKLQAVVSLIGPSHAEEVVIRLLTLVSATSLSEKHALLVQQMFSNDYFRVYTQSDEIGAELGVSYKNAIAIASGILAGLGYGDNARAALITRGLAEMVRYGTHFGAEEKTYLGLTGLGDLIVTCNSVHSRNFQAGYAIGKNDEAQTFLATNTKTVEGIRTTKVLFETAKLAKLDVPIINAIYNVLYKNKRPSDEVNKIMLRPLKEEF